MLQKLTQKSNGELFSFSEATKITDEKRKGVLKTFVLPHPKRTIDLEIEDILKKNPTFLPEGANAYIASESNPNTVHTKGDKHNMFSVYAIQFYEVPENQLV